MTTGTMMFPNYQPRDSQPLHEQTTLFGKPEGVGTTYFYSRTVNLILQ